MSTTHDRWRSIVAGYESSGLTVADYCDGCKISPTSFYRWRRLLDRADPEAFAPMALAPRTSRSATYGASTLLAAPAFVEAIVRTAAGSTSTAPVIEVRRWRVVVPDGFDQVTLGRVVATLERLDVDVDVDVDVDAGVETDVGTKGRAVSWCAEVRP